MGYVVAIVDIMLQYRATIVTTCHFVPKISTIKEWVHFLDRSVFCFEEERKLRKGRTWLFLVSSSL
jgi:hypothetical protein